MATFSEPYAGWRDLFGGFYFVLPSHLLEGKNRNKVMKDGYAFSGGPWKLEGGKAGWKKGKTITLVPNDAFWGTKPTIGKVIFQFIPESSAELEAVKTGQVVAAYPLPIDGVLDQLDESPDLSYTVGFGNQFEGFFINAKAFPLNSQAVRQAIAYATDRQVIVDQILVAAIREGRVLQSFIVPTFRQFYVPSFERYAPDQGMVDELMIGDGWEQGSDGIWEKNGQKASFEINSTAGQREPCADRADLAEPAPRSRLRPDDQELELGRAVRRAPAEGPVRRRALRIGGDARPGPLPDLLLGEHPVQEEQERGQQHDVDERSHHRRDMARGRRHARRCCARHRRARKDRPRSPSTSHRSRCSRAPCSSSTTTIVSVGTSRTTRSWARSSR